MPSNVVPIRAGISPCRFRETCPVHLGTTNIDDPVAAIYTIITASGQIINGAYKVKPHQLKDLLNALDLLTIKLHRVLAA